MKILLLGKDGQIGWELQRALAPLGEVIALDRHTAAGGLSGDISRLDALRTTLRLVMPDVIVNAAAFTQVDSAETQRHEATLINTLAVGVMAQEAERQGALLVHYSTDYVFNGTNNRPWTETDVAEPLNHYGMSKLGGEQAIQLSGCRHLILRTSWVYSARRSNFAKTILRLAAERDSLNVINDQVGAPTGAALLADVAAQLIPAVHRDGAVGGLYHVCNAGETSWYEYAKFLIDRAQHHGARLKAHSLNGVASTEYPSITVRPLNSRMSTHKLTSEFSLYLPHWQLSVENTLRELLGQ
ncbi:dTDP-4-dehydrorhamnose reductase [Pseudomonas sp. dw_358]|uniref:dTDP-4-dehydrorhamnose reductase n=1 Tax=Pseudomonas sp. dw_358 TaxID=2720083 RepID=UPI001BD5BA91|nr:dTDP-4-dehydrorhamnose reductase [Pseudomonas sp. dw_358]